MKVRRNIMGTAITARMGLMVEPIFMQMDLRTGSV